MTMFRYLVNWQMTEMQTRLCINLNQTYYRNWYCVWEAIYQLVYNWGVHGICQSNNFPVLRFLIPTPNSVGKNINNLFYLWNISLSDLPFGSRPNIWQVFDMIEIHTINWWQWYVDLTDCFPPIHSSQSLHFVYFK